MFSYSDRGSSSPDLDEIAERSLKGWIPAQPKVIENIGKKIRCGAYGNSSQMLIEDLKQDLSAYLFILRAFLDKSIFLEDEQSAGGSAPFNILVPLLEGIQETYNDDRLKNGSESQLEIVKESILASTTVEALSASFSLDKGFAYSISSLRSLGKLLIAWNYPKEFHNAIEILTQSPENTSLETILTNLFGYSPAQIGAKVAQKMGLKTGVYTLIQNPSIVVQTSNSTTSVHNRLNCVCGFGEQFAMAHSTLPHNISEKSLSEIVKVIESSIGADGISNIYRKSNLALASYKNTNPKVFATLNVNSNEKIVDPSQFSLRTEINRLARKAEVENLDLLSEIILDFEDPTNKLLSIKKLLGELIPGEGVDSIVMYTIDSVERDLIPICKKGNPSFVKMKDSCPIFGPMTNGLVRDVFDSKNNHQVEGLNAEKEEVIAVLAPYPSKKPYGVIYIEAKKNKFSAPRLGALSDLVVTVLSKLYQ